MKLSEKAIKEFKEIYEKEFQEKIDDVIAQEKARRLLNLYKIIYGTMLRENENGSVSMRKL